MAGLSINTGMAISVEKTGKTVAVGTDGTNGTNTYFRSPMISSYLRPRFQEIDTRTNHTAINTRPTGYKHMPRRSSYLMEWGGSCNLHSSLIGALLRGAGFAYTSGGLVPTKSASYRHVFDPITSETANAQYLSIYHEIPESAADSDKRASGGRLTRLGFELGANGCIMSFDGLALNEVNSALTAATHITDDGSIFLIAGTNASVTFGSSDIAEALLVPRSLSLMMDITLDEEAKSLSSFGHSDLFYNMIGVSGVLRGIPFTKALYEQLNWWDGVAASDTAGTSPTMFIPTITTLAVKIASDVEIASGETTVPSITFSMNKVLIRAEPFDITGDGQVLIDVAFQMVDDSANATSPITITLDNAVAATAQVGVYAGS